MTSGTSSFLLLKVLNITLDILRQFYLVFCLVLWKLLLVGYCVMVWVLFIVFRITSFGDSTKCNTKKLPFFSISIEINIQYNPRSDYHPIQGRTSNTSRCFMLQKLGYRKLRQCGSRLVLKV